MTELMEHGAHPAFVFPNVTQYSDVAFVVHVQPTTVVQSVMVNDGSAQRSMVTSLTVTFAGQAVVNAGTFQLTRAYAGVTSAVTSKCPSMTPAMASARSASTVRSRCGGVAASIRAARPRILLAGWRVIG